MEPAEKGGDDARGLGRGLTFGTALRFSPFDRLRANGGCTSPFDRLRANGGCISPFDRLRANGRRANGRRASGGGMSVRKLLDLTGKTALITGGSRGLGLQIGEALGEMGAKLVITARKADELEQARARLAAQRIDALPLVCDVSDPGAIEPMVKQALAARGSIDILVNNAGATWGAPAEEHPLEAWQKLVNLNLTGTFLVTQAVGKLSMIPKRYGKIINVASVAGLRGNPVGLLKTLGYSTTKGGLVNFTRTLAGEWGAYNI